MARYADPSCCPDCWTRLPQSPSSCPTCGLPLQGPLAAELLRLLGAADTQLAALRATSAVSVRQPELVTVGAPAAPAPPASTQSSSQAPPPPSYVAPGTGLTSASVPKILLGLGALALLVAAVIFLSVAWSFLGVGGRTTVLVLLTAAAAAGGLWLHDRDLRLGGEAMLTIAFGLVCLDVAGADHAGWLPVGDDGSAALLVTGVLLGAGAVALLVGGRTLVTPQVVAPLGLGVAALGVLDLLPDDGAASTFGVTAVLAAVAVGSAACALTGRARSLEVLVWSSGIAAGVWWLALVLQSLGTAAADASLRGLWLEGHGYGVLGAAALALVPVRLVPDLDRHHAPVTLAGRAVAACLATVGLALAWTDDGATVLVAAALVAVLAWTAAAYVAPEAWARAALFPLGLAAVPVAVLAVASSLVAAARVLDLGSPYASPADVQLPATDSSVVVAHPALLVPSVLALALGLWVALRVGRGDGTARTRLPVRPVVIAVAVAGALAGVATLALTPAPLWTVVAVVAAAAVGLLVVRQGIAALVLGALAVVASLPSEVLASGAALVLVGTVVGVLLTARGDTLREVAGLLLAPSVAVLAWSVGEVVDLHEVARAVPVLLVLGLLCVLRPRWPLEVGSVATAVVVCAASVGFADDTLTALAVHLTVVGALICATALVNDSRRDVLPVGTLVLAAATWVRLADLGVTAPEPYTLPLATVLVGLGVRRLLREPQVTTVATLLPGLLLGTVPSLLWVLGDPVSLRAALLGVGCLGLVLTGTRLRWNAPVVVGAAAGALVLLVELAPYAARTPQFVVIAAVGSVLLVVGVTWERRLRDLRTAAAYLERLR